LSEIYKNSKNQCTIKNDVSISGIGLHTGVQTTATFKPAESNSGIRFKRLDLEDCPEIIADIDHVIDISRGTTIGQNGFNIHTVEHILAAVVGLKIDNILIELTELINKLNLNNITITGLIYNVEDYLSVSDIFISASYREGVPRSVLEAQAAFLPVIATNIRGNREVVSHGVNGYIYEKGNYKELAGFIQVLAKDLEKRLIFGSKGRENVKSRYTENQYVQKQVEIISNLL